MFEIFMIELLGPIVTGYFRGNRARRLRRKLAAWIWLAASPAFIALAFWLDHPFVMGIAAGAGVFSVVASLVSSASASNLDRRQREMERHAQATQYRLEKANSVKTRSSALGAVPEPRSEG